PSRASCALTRPRGSGVKPVLESKTFTLGPTDDASMNFIKHLQGFEYRTGKWYAWHGLRSHVESNKAPTPRLRLPSPRVRRGRDGRQHATHRHLHSQRREEDPHEGAVPRTPTNRRTPHATSAPHARHP